MLQKSDASVSRQAGLAVLVTRSYADQRLKRYDLIVGPMKVVKQQTLEVLREVLRSIEEMSRSLSQNGRRGGR